MMERPVQTQNTSEKTATLCAIDYWTSLLFFRYESEQFRSYRRHACVIPMRM